MRYLIRSECCVLQLNNDLVNVLNISIGATLCILGKLALG